MQLPQPVHACGSAWQPAALECGTSVSARADDLVCPAREPGGARGRHEHEERQHEAEHEHVRAVHLRAHGERHAARALVARTNASNFIDSRYV